MNREHSNALLSSVTMDGCSEADVSGITRLFLLTGKLVVGVEAKTSLQQFKIGHCDSRFGPAQVTPKANDNMKGETSPSSSA